jgi:phosphate transport system substrate-binding protein
MSMRTWAAMVGAVVMMAACSQEKAAEAPAAPQGVRIDGSSTVFPLSKALADAFAAANAAAPAITVAESGTGGGFEKFCAGQTDISDASRPISSREMVQCFRGGVRYVEAPIGFDAITMIVHPESPVMSASIEDLRRVWNAESQGTVLMWRDANPRWPDAPLRLYGPGAASGTFDYFVAAVLRDGATSRTDYTASEDDNVIVEGVANEPNALGYVGFAYYERNKARLRALAINSGRGPVAPSAETVTNSTYTPLSRPIFIYVNLAALARPEVAQFAQYYLANVKTKAIELGYVPLPDTAYAAYAQRLAEGRAGTAFAGRAHTGESIEEVIARPLRESAS